MHKFCNGCPHLKIPDFIKEYFNEHVMTKFLECPLHEDPKVAGCTVKYLEINWSNFTKEIVRLDITTKEELSEIIKLGLA